MFVALAMTTYIFLERNLSQTIARNLSSMTRNITKELVQEGVRADDEREEGVSAGGDVTAIEAAIKEEIKNLNFIGYRFAVIDQEGKELVSDISDKKLRLEIKSLPQNEQIFDILGEHGLFRVEQKPLTLDGKKFRLFVSYSLERQTQFLESLKSIFFVSIPIALLLAGLGGYFLARQNLDPLVAMNEQAEQISSSNLNTRLPIKNQKDELGKLAKVFNSLLARLESSFRQQQRFMADASHELRTPLAIVRTESAVAILKKRNAAEYLESLTIVHDESKHLTKIVEDLFLLSRVDRGQVEPMIKLVYLDEVITDAVRAIRTLAEKRNIDIHFSELAEMPLNADESLLHRLFLNLFDNAIKYNRENGRVSVDAKQVGGKYLITVSDTGIGIPLKKQAEIFDRFYRADDVRGRHKNSRSSGAGLGLSIASWITTVHKGSLTLHKSDSSGSIFQIEFPV